MYETRKGPDAKRGYYVELWRDSKKVGQLWLADSEKDTAESLVALGTWSAPAAEALRLEAVA